MRDQAGEPMADDSGLARGIFVALAAPWFVAVALGTVVVAQHAPPKDTASTIPLIGALIAGGPPLVGMRLLRARSRRANRKL
jgi:hypothetical protein